jgi:hypothetical protein
LQRRRVHINLVGKDGYKDVAVDGGKNIKWILEKWDGVWTGFIWLKIGTRGRLL